MSSLHFCCWGAARWKIASYVQLSKSTICQVDMPTFPKTMPRSMMTFFLSEVSLYLSEFILVASSVWAESFVDKIYKTSPSIHHCTIQCLNLFFPFVSRLHLEPKRKYEPSWLYNHSYFHFPIWISNLSCTLFVVLCGTSAVEGWIDADFDCGNK